MAENKLRKDATNFNQLIANDIRSKLLLLTDKECNRKFENHPRNHFRINSRGPEELKINTIFYIQIDIDIIDNGSIDKMTRIRIMIDQLLLII